MTLACFVVGVLSVPVEGPVGIFLGLTMGLMLGLPLDAGLRGRSGPVVFCWFLCPLTGLFTLLEASQRLADPASLWYAPWLPPIPFPMLGGYLGGIGLAWLCERVEVRTGRQPAQVPMLALGAGVVAWFVAGTRYPRVQDWLLPMLGLAVLWVAARTVSALLRANSARQAIEARKGQSPLGTANPR